MALKRKNGRRVLFDDVVVFCAFGSIAMVLLLGQDRYLLLKGKSYLWVETGEWVQGKKGQILRLIFTFLCLIRHAFFLNKFWLKKY
jgi:hypothetical protein